MIAVIGCGNLNRRDDGVGPEVVRVLRERGLEREDVKLLDAGTDGMAVMFAARGCSRLVVVDAANMLGAEPGAVYEAPGSELERPYAPGLNLHDFRWDAALHAGRQIFKDAFPADVTVLLIQAEDLGLGLGLTPKVAAAAGKVAARIAELIAPGAIEAPACPAPPMETVGLARGSLHLSADLCARRFAGCDGVVLLRRERDLLVLPVQQAAGGYLLKQRNLAGDRVVQAADFFREQGLADDMTAPLTGAWSEADAALILRDVFPAK